MSERDSRADAEAAAYEASRRAIANAIGEGQAPTMDARLAVLETDVRDIKGILGRLEPLLKGMDERLRKVEVDVAELKGRVALLPSAMQVFLYMGGLVTLVIAVLGAFIGISNYLGFHH